MLDVFIPVIRGEPFQIITTPQVSVPLISRPVGSYWEGGTTPLLWSPEVCFIQNQVKQDSDFKKIF